MSRGQVGNQTRNFNYVWKLNPGQLCENQRWLLSMSLVQAVTIGSRLLVHGRYKRNGCFPSQWQWHNMLKLVPHTSLAQLSSDNPTLPPSPFSLPTSTLSLGKRLPRIEWDNRLIGYSSKNSLPQVSRLNR